ncbi:hypothetical protein HKX48_001190 [Thoreauomyces humboldtii]|nr:hypothetical protein HKX48_001190 [Thoreauomyces humboldtii]
MLDPVLYDHFAEAHAELARQGLAIEFEIHEEGDDPAASEIADIWLTFGPESKVLSTLMKGRVLERFNPLGFVRDVSREVGGDWHLFREVTFEYVIPQSASSDPRAPGSPSFSLRGKTIEKGQIVGLDVNVPMSLTARCRDVETDDVLWEEEVRRTVSVRFDSPHFTDSTEGGWVIADVDRLRQAERIVEEERCLGRLPGDDE